MNLDRVLKSLLSSPASAGLAGAVAGGLLASKSGRKIGGKALQVGGVAAIAGLAYAAWQRHQREAGSVAISEAEPSPQQLRDAGFLPIAAKERAELFGEVERPVTLDEVVVSATTRQRALELYAASRLAIEPDSPAERGYLSLLAARLDLDDALVASIEREAAAEIGSATARPTG